MKKDLSISCDPLERNRAKSPDTLKKAIVDHLRFSLAHPPQKATSRDWWMATCKAVQDLILEKMMATMAAHHEANTRRIYYLSLEYLMGRLLSSNLHNAGVENEVREALAEMGQDLDALIAEEADMGLGNGGLGRLAACFLDSMATLDLPAVGYGIRYEFGLFRQSFENGHQVEHPDAWLRFGDVWEVIRPEYSQRVEVYGTVENVFDDRGAYKPRWVDTHTIMGIPYDIPICGYDTNTVNFLRLWQSGTDEVLDFHRFNEGGYVEALRAKNESETITKVLYPNDETENGKELRLVQQYFFVACSLRDIIRRHLKSGNNWNNFSDKVCVQLNDTHPAVAVAELMRLLHDEYDMPWDEAWGICTRTFAYTNHTLLPEALEQWRVELFRRVLPRHAMLIEEINRRHLLEVEARWPGDAEKREALSIIAHGHFRMAYLAVVGSFSVNGVAALHSELLKRFLFRNFDEFYPGKLNNKTNGITPRRWLLAINPKLADLYTEQIGPGWVKQLDQLRELEGCADDPEFRARFRSIKLENKQRLADTIRELCGITVNPEAMFDVQIKRLHEYKRQHLNLLHILALYHRLLQGEGFDTPPRVFIFGAKAAPGYDMAKTIIKAINAVGKTINADERIKDQLKVAFLPNYRVSLASQIIPASDLSEQISTAGKEASGTGNMKLSLNGALTIGTLDGANIEIREEVGEENFFLFGKTVEEVNAIRAAGYNPNDWIDQNEELRTMVDWLGSNYFAPDEPGQLTPLKQSFTEWGDPYLVMADYEDYVACQSRVGEAFKDADNWSRMAILNSLRVGKFSSDRTIREYAQDIWRLDPVSVLGG